MPVSRLQENGLWSVPYRLRPAAPLRRHLPWLVKRVFSGVAATFAMGLCTSLCAEVQGQSSHSQAKAVRRKVGDPSSAGRFAVAKSRQPSASSVSVGNEGQADKCTEIAILKHTKSYTNKPHLII